MNLTTTTKGFRVLLTTFVFVLTIGTISVSAQRDLIRTQAGEEIRCRIIDETPVRFVFAYLKNDKLYRSEIFKNLVTSFKYDFYTEDLPFAELLPKSLSRGSESLSTQTTRSLSQNDNGKKIRKNKSGKKDIYSSNDSLNTTEATNEPITKQKTLEEEVNAKYNSENKTTNRQEEKESASMPVAKKEVRKSQPTTQQKTFEEGVAVKNDSESKTTKRQAEKVLPSKSVTSRQETDIKRESAPSSQAGKQTIDRKTEKTGIVKDKDAAVKNAVATGSEDKVSINDTELPKIAINQANKFRIGVKAGIGNRIDNSLQTINTYDLYLEQLLRGYVFGADLGYFPTDALGFGLTYTDFRSRNSDNNIVYRNAFTGNEATGSIGNRRSVKFIGPTLFLRKKLDYKTYVVLGLSPGYNFYTDNGNYDGLNYTFTGKGFGAASTLGIDFLLGNDIIGRDIILSFEAGYNYGKINALDYGDSRGAVTLSNPLSINRLDFTVGLRFIRFPKYFRLTSY